MSSRSERPHVRVTRWWQLAYAATPLSLSREGLNFAVDEASGASVNVSYLHKGRTKLHAVDEQLAAQKALEEAVEAAETYPSNQTRATVAETWEHAANKGVAMEAMLDAQKRCVSGVWIVPAII